MDINDKIAEFGHGVMIGMVAPVCFCIIFFIVDYPFDSYLSNHTYFKNFIVIAVFILCFVPSAIILLIRRRFIGLAGMVISAISTYFFILHIGLGLLYALSQI